MQHTNGFTSLNTLLAIALGAALLGGAAHVVHTNREVARNSTATTALNTPSSREVTSGDSAKKEKLILSVGEVAVTVFIGDRVAQTIPFSDDALDALSVNNLVRKVITDQDINFDGHNDLAMMTGIGYGGVNVFFSYYFYDPKGEQFIPQVALTELSNPTLDTKNKTLTTNTKSGPDAYTTTYTWNGTYYKKGKTFSDATGQEYVEEAYEE